MEITLKDIKELLCNSNNELQQKEIDTYWHGKKCIVRTYSAGVFYGEIEIKAGDEVILKNSRRLYYWKTVNGGISLSEIAMRGLHDDSKVCEAELKKWCRAIEIIECTPEAIKNIEEKNDYTN